MVGIGICLNTIQEKTSLLLVIAISLAFAWILWPFYGAVLWATVLAIVFAPLYRRLSRSMQRHNLAALTTVVIVILPSTLITASLVQEAAGMYGKFQSGELNVARDFQRIVDALPTWVTNLLDRFGLTNLTEMQERLLAGLVKGSQFFSQALNIGQITFEVSRTPQAQHSSLSLLNMRVPLGGSRPRHHGTELRSADPAENTFVAIRQSTP
jgi:predicted PurR-regulated permease PerM